MEYEIATKVLDQIYTIKRWVFDDSDKIYIKLPCYRSISIFWNISGCLGTQLFYSYIGGYLKEF